MGVQLLDDAARVAFDRAIKSIEGASAVEVVVALRRRSGDYHHANAIVGFAVAAIVLAALLFSEPTYTLGGILLAPFVFGAVAAVGVEWIAPLKRVLTSRKSRRAHVLRAARATFVERGVHNTTGRSGVLAYISLLEHQIVLVPDGGLAATIADGVLARIGDAMTAAMPAGGTAVAAALEKLAPEAARAMPHADDDRNELPDMIDTGDDA